MSIAKAPTNHFGHPVRLFRQPPPPPRPVDPEWQCQRSGDCCRAIDMVVMTDEERAVLQSAADARLTMGELSRLQWAPDAQPGFVRLLAGPCPFLRDGNRCVVHDVRPYNCRRFGCLRPDVEAEPLQMAPISAVALFGDVGCSNLRERLVQSRIARKIYGLLQRKGQRWARQHGWEAS